MMDLLLSPEALSYIGVTSQHFAVFLAFLGFLGVLGAVLSTLWAAVKILYTSVTKKPFPATKWTRRADLLLQLLVNIPGAINKARKDSGKDPLFPTSTPPADP